MAVVAGVMAAACSSGSGESDAPSSSADAVTSTTSAPSTSEMPAATSLPDAVARAEPLDGLDALFLPDELPQGWEVTTITVLPRFTSDAAGVASLVAWRTGTDFDAGGAQISVERFADPAASAPSGIFDFVESSPFEVEGLAGTAQVAVDGAFVSLAARVDDTTLVSVFGDLPAEDLGELAAGIVVEGETDDLTAAVEADGWSSATTRIDGSVYEVGVTGPTGAIQVFVTVGAARESLHVGGTQLTERLEGARGEGYRMVQRVDSEGLEFPFVEWWVPGASLSTGDRSDIEVVTMILDSFVEVPAVEWDDRLAGVAVSAFEPGPPVDTDPRPLPDGDQLDAEVLERISGIVEAEVGRSFDGDVEVSIVDGADLRASVPDGMFVTESTWEVLAALGLVDVEDDRGAAEAARIEQLRGICCPVTVIDTGDATFNEIVVAHELTHLLDAEIATSGGSVGELVDPAQALLEGNAHRVAFAYADMLAADGAMVPEPPAVFPPGDDPRLPPAVRELLEFPYDEGLAFARALADRGGTEAVDAAFASPPLSSEQVLDLDAYLADEGAEVVSPPDLADGEPGRTGTIGAFVLRLLLTEEIPAEQADELSIAWEGDAFLLFDGPNGTCIDLRLSLDDDTAARAVADALESRAELIERSGREVDARLCSA